MGIRFHCPNGHKLNVKAFLAGKKGVCPDCGVKLRIPERSEPGLGGDDDAPVQAQLSEPAPAANTYSAATAVARPAPAPMPMSAPVAPVHPAAPLASNVPRGLGLAPAPVAMPVAPLAHPAMRPPGAPATAIPPPPPPGVSDAITENPLATWFVRPPSGGQFGPARGEIMRKWITEGRVTSDSLVWREGWTDWLPATEVFPSLGKPAAPLFSGASSSTKPVSSLPPAKKGGGVGVAILVLLAIICVVLVGVLAIVLSGSLSST